MFSDYEPIPSSSGTDTSAPQIVLCISGAIVLCVHKSLQLVDNNSLLVNTVIHSPAGRSLLANENLQSNIHIFSVST